MHNRWRYTTFVSFHSFGQARQQSVWMVHSVDAVKEWPEFSARSIGKYAEYVPRNRRMVTESAVGLLNDLSLDEVCIRVGALVDVPHRKTLKRALGGEKNW